MSAASQIREIANDLDDLSWSLNYNLSRYVERLEAIADSLPDDDDDDDDAICLCDAYAPHKRPGKCPIHSPTERG